MLLPLVAACRLLQNMEGGVRGKDGGRHNLKMPAYPMQGYTSVHQVVASSLAGLGDMLATNAYWFVPYDQVCKQVHTVSDVLRFFGETDTIYGASAVQFLRLKHRKNFTSCMTTIVAVNN